MGQHDTAMDDYDTAVDKNSRSIDARVSRAKAYEDAGELKDALSDLEDAADYLPAESDVHGQIGSLQWDLGRFDDAEKTFKSVVDGIAPSPYAPIWLYLSQAKADSGTLPVMREGKVKSDDGKWPAPLLRLFSSGVSAEGVLKAASEGDTSTKVAHLCEADFYAGEWHLFHGAPSEAARLLNEAARSCGNDTIEKVAATAELARIERDAQ
jgi:tetratricopeptide (TPR) repeat protein